MIFIEILSNDISWIDTFKDFKKKMLKHFVLIAMATGLLHESKLIEQTCRVSLRFLIGWVIKNIIYIFDSNKCDHSGKTSILIKRNCVFLNDLFRGPLGDVKYLSWKSVAFVSKLL